MLEVALLTPIRSCAQVLPGCVRELVQNARKSEGWIRPLRLAQFEQPGMAVGLG